jgi:hypothetical protein
VSNTSPTELLIQRATQARAARVHVAEAARSNPKVFAQFVLRDEGTGNAIKLAPIHRSWHDLMSTRKRLVVWSHIESGKTSQISIGRVLYELGRDTSLRACVLSNTHHQAVKIVRTISRYIEQSAELALVFPKLRPGKQWTESALTVDRPFLSKDPSVQAIGIHGNITGARLDLVIVDDVLDYENTRTPKGRDELWDWMRATLTGRLTSNARFFVVGTAFHPEDALHRYAKQFGPESAVRYPVLADVDGTPRWPERWSRERIEEKRTELGPVEFARQMLCVPRDDTQATFKREWVDIGLRKGNGRSLAFGLKVLPPGIKTYTGVDLAVQQHASADLTVLFTIAVHPNGDREVLWVESGRWAGPEIVMNIINTHQRYQSIVVVENNAAQDFILQFTRAKAAVPLRSFTTGRNKAHPEFGVQSLAAELANGKWLIPNEDGRTAPEVDAWISELLYYDPKGHTGDRLMASWFAREGARMGSIKAQVGSVDLLSR